MTNKKLWIAIGVLAIAVLLAWRWMGRTPSEADDPDHSQGANITEAAVVRVERRELGNTLTIAGSSSLSRTWKYTPKLQVTFEISMSMSAIT